MVLILFIFIVESGASGRMFGGLGGRRKHLAGRIKNIASHTPDLGIVLIQVGYDGAKKIFACNSFDSDTAPEVGSATSGRPLQLRNFLILIMNKI